MSQSSTAVAWRKALVAAIASGKRMVASELVLSRSLEADVPVSDIEVISADACEGFAFAFDIDGVLIQSRDSIPNAMETLQYLLKNEIPFMFLTNSGGQPEAVRIAGLNSRFNTTLSVDQFQQSHTPFLSLVPEYQDKTVLVVGGAGDDARQTALQYGFKTVVTTADIITAVPSFWPFKEISVEYYKLHAKPLPKPFNPEDPANSLQIDLILVFSSPRDWGCDAQLCLDLLKADNGVLGTVSPLNGNVLLPNHGYQQQPGSCKIQFSNPDFVWKTGYAHGPRFGQGAFITALEAIFNEDSDYKAFLISEKVGKPHRSSYLYAEDVLVKKSGKPFKNVYMIGDNPLSDIKGANDFRSPRGTKWESILVETGVHVAGTIPSITPTTIVYDVRDAVNWALKREGCKEMVFEDRSADDSSFVVAGMTELG